MKEDVLALAKQYIAISSFVDDNTDEQVLVDFLETLIRSKRPDLLVQRQFLSGSKRANLIVKGPGNIKLLVVGHVDTVQPNDGWQTDPVTPIVRGGKLYGLGAADMKGSMAAFLTAMCDKDVTLDGLMLLLYADEEYNFEGMR